MTRDILFYVSGLCVIGCLGTLTYVLATPGKTQVTELGERGYQRQLARRSSIFLLCEPGLLLLAAWLSTLPITSFRPKLASLLRQAGNILGLSPDEFLGCCVVSASLGAVFASQLFSDFLPVATMAMLSSFLPYIAVTSTRDARTIAVTRALPASMELIALCVSAGMDFPGALREVVGGNPSKDDVLNAEYRQLLRDLDLGHSRRQALLAFEGRSGGAGVSDFVAAIIQSEEKGNPLKDVLMTQAKVLQVRRSFRAEEMATQAGLKMVIPLTILMMMVLAIIISPLMLSMREQGF